MAVPLDIVHPGARMKSMSFRPSRSKRCSSPPHPLEDDAASDSETEYSSDFSCCSPTSSVTTSSFATSSFAESAPGSLHTSGLRSASSPPVLLPCLASATRVAHLDASKSTKSKLSALLSKSQPKQKTPTAFKSVDTVAGQKTTARTSWQMFSAFVISYSMVTHRGTEDKYPLVKSTSETAKGSDSLFDFEPDHEVYVEKELTTFSETRKLDMVELTASTGRVRNREYRINSDFLKRYALDSSARANGVLPGPSGQPVHTSPAIQQFNNAHGLHKYSEMSRDKLWNSVVLPPRSDPCPRSTIDYEQFVLVGEATSGLIAKNSRYVPWAAHQSSLKPAGALSGCQSLRSASSPTSGATAPQYTIAGWQSTRWAPQLA